jgi:hypothetical protein
LANLPNDGPYLMVPFEVFTWIYVQRRPIDISMENPKDKYIEYKTFQF